MLEGILRTAAVVVSAIALVSFGLFALDETRDAAKQSAAEVAGLNASSSADPSTSEERARERAHGSVREAIDDVDDVLVAPFASISDHFDSAWARRGVAALLAVVVYGFGLAYLARFARGRG